MQWTLQSKPICKTVVSGLWQPWPNHQHKNKTAPGKPYVEPNITIKGKRVNVVEKITYLGNSLSKTIVMDDEVNSRLAKATIREASRRRPKSRYTELSFLPPSFMVVKLDYFLASPGENTSRTVKFLLGFLFLVSTPSWCNHSFVGTIMLSARKITASRRNSLMVNSFKARTSREARKKCFKDTLKFSIKSFGITFYDLEYHAQDI